MMAEELAIHTNYTGRRESRGLFGFDEILGISDGDIFCNECSLFGGFFRCKPQI